MSTVRIIAATSLSVAILTSCTTAPLTVDGDASSSSSSIDYRAIRLEAGKRSRELQEEQEHIQKLRHANHPNNLKPISIVAVPEPESEQAQQCTSFEIGTFGGKTVTFDDMWEEQSFTTPELAVVSSMACIRDANGTITHAVHFRGMNDAAFYSLIGLVPKTNLLYAVRTSYAVEKHGGDPDCELLVIDLTSPHRTAAIAFDPRGHIGASCPKQDIDVDLSQFDFSKPRFRFRIKEAGSTTFGEWMTWPTEH